MGWARWRYGLRRSVKLIVFFKYPSVNEPIGDGDNRIPSDFTFPQYADQPALRPKFPLVLPIPLNRAFKFGEPVPLIACRCAGMFAAFVAVPEAAMDKNDGFEFR